MDNFVVERDWTTKAGFRAVVIMGRLGHRCGYVGLPPSHPLHGADYGEASPALSFPADEPVGKRGIIPLMCCNGEARPDAVFDVHGGLTYSGNDSGYPAKSDGLWWFGFDCGHSGDRASDEYLAAQRKKYPEHQILWLAEGVHRTLEYCVDECESLAAQMVSRVAESKGPTP